MLSMPGWWTSVGIAFSVIFPFTFNHQYFCDLIQFEVCIYVYKSIWKWHMKLVCELKSNQEEACGGPLQQHLPWPVQNQCCDYKGGDFHSHVPPSPSCTTGNRRWVKMKLHKCGDQLPLSSCFSCAKQCVMNGLQACKRFQELRV